MTGRKAAADFAGQFSEVLEDAVAAKSFAMSSERNSRSCCCKVIGESSFDIEVVVSDNVFTSYVRSCMQRKHGTSGETGHTQHTADREYLLHVLFMRRHARPKLFDK